MHTTIRSEDRVCGSVANDYGSAGMDRPAERDWADDEDRSCAKQITSEATDQTLILLPVITQNAA